MDIIGRVTVLNAVLAPLSSLTMKTMQNRSPCLGSLAASLLMLGSWLPGGMQSWIGCVPASGL